MFRNRECTLYEECCKTVNITGAQDHGLKELDSLGKLKRYMSYLGMRVVDEGAEKNYSFIPDIPCIQLTWENTWQVYNTPGRPLICYCYPREPDDIPDCGYRFKN